MVFKKIFAKMNESENHWKQQRIAIIDIGSNTIRLVIYHVQIHGQIIELVNVKRMARLKEYIDLHQQLTTAGMEIVIDVLQKFKEIIDDLEVEQVIAIATAAIRQAVNQDIVIRQILEQTGIQVQVISGTEEAAYGYLSVVNSTFVTNGVIMDIGGGSTELSLFKQKKLVESVSLPFGSITLKQNFVKEENPTVEELSQLHAFLQDQWNAITWIHNCQLPLIGIGGTARTIAKVHYFKHLLCIPDIHQLKLMPKEFNQTLEWLASMSLQKRKKVEGLGTERADLIVPSAMAIQSLMNHTKAPVFIFSRKGIREGVIYQEILKQGMKQWNQVAEHSIYQLLQERGVNPNKLVELKLLHQLIQILTQNTSVTLSKVEEQYLYQAVKLAALGKIDTNQSDEFLFRLLTSRSLDGFSHMDQCKVALIASYKSKNQMARLAKQRSIKLSERERKKLELLGAMLRLVESLTCTRRDIISQMGCLQDEDGIAIRLLCNKDFTFEEEKANKVKKHLEKALNEKIRLHFTCNI